MEITRDRRKTESESVERTVDNYDYGKDFVKITGRNPNPKDLERVAKKLDPTPQNMFERPIEHGLFNDEARALAEERGYSPEQMSEAMKSIAIEEKISSENGRSLKNKVLGYSIAGLLTVPSFAYGVYRGYSGEGPSADLVGEGPVILPAQLLLLNLATGIASAGILKRNIEKSEDGIEETLKSIGLYGGGVMAGGLSTGFIYPLGWTIGSAFKRIIG